MYLYYNGTWFDKNEAAVTITKRPFFNQRGFRQYTRETWHVNGLLQSTGQTGMTAALAARQVALAVNGGDIGIYLDDQATLTNHYLLSSQSLGGTRITAYDFPVGTGAEYSDGDPNYRSYSFSIEADFPDTSHTLLFFKESLKFVGNGGPHVVYLPLLQGDPEQQFTTDQTTYKAIQQGRAIGYGGWPPIPGPIWPAAELGEFREIDPDGPSIWGGAVNEFEISWKYVFESSQALSGIPTIA